MFINSCFIHCQTLMAETWHSPNAPKIDDKVRKVFSSDLHCGNHINDMIIRSTVFLGV